MKSRIVFTARHLSRFALLLCLAAFAFAQTTVTGTIVDPNSNPYANGTVSAKTVAATGQPTISTSPASLNGSGFFSITLNANTYIFTVCAMPVQLGPTVNPTPKQVCFSSTPIAISGGSMDVSATLNPLAAVLGPRLSGGPSITLQTNGVNNGSQSTLNLQQGSNVTLTDNGFGQVTIASSGGGGGGSPGSPTASLQVNNGAGGFAGSTAQNGTTTETYSTTTGQHDVPNLNRVRTVTPSYNWTSSQGGSLVIGSNTVTLTPCPLGVDVSGFTQAQYKVSVNSGAEYAAVTGGTCTSGGATGTIIIFVANNYGPTYTLGSGSGGLQETVIDACNSPLNAPPQVGGQCEVDLQSNGLAGITNVNYTVGTTTHLWTRNGANIHLHGHNASIRCNTRDACIFAGQRNGSTIGVTMDHITFFPGLNIDGAQVADVTWASGTLTVHTQSAHPYVVGDCVSVRYSTPGSSQKGLYKVATVADNTHFTSTTNCLNTANANLTISNSSGFGWTNIENTAIEDNANQSAYDHIYISASSPNNFSFDAVVDNDQHAIFNDFVLEHGGPKCTANFCGESIYGPANQGAAIIEIHHSDLSSQCSGNGPFNDSGNGMLIEDTISQAFAQTGYAYGPNPFQGATLKDAYLESGPTCVNPYYPGGTQQGAQAGMFLQRNTVLQGQTPIQGNFPTFIAGGITANQINYFVQPISSTKGRGPYLPVGIALPVSGAVTINVAWPSVNLSCGLAGSCGTITYDLIATVGGAAYTPLTGTGTWGVSTGLSCTPTTAGFCTFADTQAARSSYTIQPQAWGPATSSGGFSLWWWPGGLVVDGGPVFAEQLPNGAGIVSTWGSINANIVGAQCVASNAVNQITMVAPAGSYCFTGDPLVGQGFRANIMNLLDTSNNGAPAVSKGIINIQREQNFPNYAITLGDGSRQATMASINKRPLASVNDTGIGHDALNQIFLAAPTSISSYINLVPDNAGWLERLTASLKTFKVPLQLNGSSTGSAQIGVAAAAGTPNKLNLPTSTAAQAGAVLMSDGGNPQQLSWSINCGANGSAANPSVVLCTAATEGAFTCDVAASAGTCQVNTTAVTANSNIIVQQVSYIGARLSKTCNTASALPAGPLTTTISAGASFTIALGTFTTNPACFTYIIRD